MRQITLKIPAGQVIEVAQTGNYVRVRESSVDLTIENPDKSEIIEVSEGDDFEFSPFRNLRISHQDAAEQTIKLVISSGKRATSAKVGGSIALSGAVALDAATLAALESVSINNQQGPFTSTAKTVTNASGSMVAANAARRYLLIQNNHATGNIFVNLAGVAATTANGVKIAPGGSLELQGYVPNGQIFAIGDIASNTAVLVVEG